MGNTEANGNGSGHPIQVVARRTGLSPDVLRAWERRYAAVTPSRSPTNRRLYSAEDVEKLELLRRVTDAGRRIGDVSGLSIEALRAMVEEDDRTVAAVRSRQRRTAGASRDARDAGAFLDDALRALDALDAASLEGTLNDAATALSPTAVVEELLAPLMREVGRRWRDGTMRIMHEHLATSVVQGFLHNLKISLTPSDDAADLVVATPAGQHHELGALMVAIGASLDDWRVTYLGPSLPAEEIAGAARSRNARAVALSIVYPAVDARLSHEFRKLARLLGEDTLLVAGGEGASRYREVIEEVGGVVTDDIASLRLILSDLLAKGD